MNTTAVPQPRLCRNAHGKRAAHQTRDALETAATVSSHLKHRDRAKSRKNDSLVPSQAPRLLKTRKNSSLVPSQAPRPHKTPEKQQSRPISSTETAQNPGKTAVSSLLKHRDSIKPRKSSSLVPSQAPRPHKTPEKQQSRPFSSTETTHNPRKTAVSSLLKHRDRTKSRKNSSLVPSQAPRPHTTEGREEWDSYYVLPGRGWKVGKDGVGRRRRDEAGREGKARRSGGAGAVRMSGRKEVWRGNPAAGGRTAGFAPGTRGKAAAAGRAGGFAHGRRETAAAGGRTGGFAPGTRENAAAGGQSGRFCTREAGNRRGRGQNDRFRTGRREAQRPGVERTVLQMDGGEMPDSE